MRDRRFVAEHRGGPLTKDQHRQLIAWACECTNHALPLLAGHVDMRVAQALFVAEKWKRGAASAGEARKASTAAHASAREAEDAVSAAIARSAGHAAATAHMADHSLGAAMYALKAVRVAGGSVEEERMWQNERLPEEIRELVLAGREKKEKHFKI